MTAPTNSSSNGGQVFSDISLLTLVDDDSYTFISNTIPESSEDIVDWFDRNAEEIGLNSDSMMSNKPDPLLIQFTARDSPTLLRLSEDIDIDTDTLGDICMNMLDSSESDYFDPSESQFDSHIISKIDKNMNSLSKENNPIVSTVQSVKNKCDILESELKYGLTIEVSNSNSKLQVRLRNQLGTDVFPIHYLPLNESGHVNQSLIRQQVKLLEQISLSSNLETRMPCLHSKLGLRVWFCPHFDCCRAFYRYNFAKLHALRHLDHKPFKCDFPDCEWAFYTSFKLKRHQETHSKRKDFACPYSDCDRCFTTIYNLNWHRRHYHEKPATLPCLVNGCDEYFQTVRARELHIKAHGNGEAPYRCPVTECNKPFFFLTALSKHSRVHLQKAELRCQWPNCGRVFEQPCRLKQHSLQHSGYRPYMCTYSECKWAFSTASKLKRHLSTHTNERKFHCTIGSCNKSFLRSEHLKDHTLTHIGQRPFHCVECNATFSGKSGLCLHIKKNHQKLTDVCARVIPYQSTSLDSSNSEDLLARAIESLKESSPDDEKLEPETKLTSNKEESVEGPKTNRFSTVNLRDLD